MKVKIAIIGTGYVGLVTGICLADVGHNVTCIDIDASKIDLLNKGISPIYEPGLEELLIKNIKNNQLSFSNNYEDGLQYAEVIYIAVGTPQSSDGAAELSYVLQAARRIAETVTQDTVVVTKSTVPVGTNKLVLHTIQENLTKNVKVDVVSNPEFLREGHAIQDAFYGDRIVIGTESEMAFEIVREVYKDFNIPVLKTSIESAEMIKYASNAFLAAKISFINEIANLCEKTGANVQDVAEGMGMDGRIGRAFLNAGIGYGGSCFPKDTEALIHMANEVGYEFNILRQVSKVNRKQRSSFVRKIEERMETVAGKQIAVLGLSFKPNTDDMREAPSITIVNELMNKGARIVAFDPVAVDEAKKILPSKVEYVSSIYEAVKVADCCLILTEWAEIKEMDLQEIEKIMKEPIIFDGRNCLPISKLEETEIEYYPVGFHVTSEKKVRRAQYVR